MSDKEILITYTVSVEKKMVELTINDTIGPIKMYARDALNLATALRDGARRVTWNGKQEGKTFKIDGGDIE